MSNCVNSSHVTLIYLPVVYLLDSFVPWHLKKELIPTKIKIGLGKIVPIVIVMDARTGPAMKLKNFFFPENVSKFRIRFNLRQK